MRILILGISGLIGHKLFQELSPYYEVFGTLHRQKEHYGNKPLFATDSVIENVDVNEFEILKVIFGSLNEMFPNKALLNNSILDESPVIFRDLCPK